MFIGYAKYVDILFIRSKSLYTKSLVVDVNAYNYVASQLKIVVMKQLVLSLIIFFLMVIIYANVVVAFAVIITQKIMLKIKIFFVIVIKHKENPFGVIIF